MTGVLHSSFESVMKCASLWMWPVECSIESPNNIVSAEEQFRSGTEQSHSIKPLRTISRHLRTVSQNNYPSSRNNPAPSQNSPTEQFRSATQHEMLIRWRIRHDFGKTVSQ